MTEILTESFCERCGTRYTFESAAPRQRRLGGLKVLGRGLQHFVMTDDSSLDESIAAARSDLERDATNNQLDAFHRTFSFCMSCRQYTCTNCWNESEARCLSCAPLEIAELAPVLDTEIDADRLRRFMGGESEVGHHHDAAAPFATTTSGPIGTASAIFALPEGWIGAGNGADVEATATESAGIELLGNEPVEAVASAAIDPLPTLTAQPAAVDIVEAEPLFVVDAEAAGLEGLADGQSLDDAIAAFELALEVEATTPAIVPNSGTETRAAEPALETPATEAALETSAAEASVASEPAGEPSAAASSPDPGTTAPAAQNADEPPPASDVPSGPESTPNGVDSVVQPVWRAPADPAATPPQWPTGPRWPTGLPTQAAPMVKAAPVDALAALMARSSTDAMWAASSQEILQPAAVKAVASVHSCVNCGISLSANARFCRRCGTPQG